MIVNILNEVLPRNSQVISDDDDVDAQTASPTVTLSPLIYQPGTERVQALDDISRSGYCRGNETRAPIANPPNNGQLGAAYHSLSYIRVRARRAVVWESCDGQTHRRRVTNIHFTSSTTYAKCKESFAPTITSQFMITRKYRIVSSMQAAGDARGSTGHPRRLCRRARHPSAMTTMTTMVKVVTRRRAITLSRPPSLPPSLR